MRQPGRVHVILNPGARGDRAAEFEQRLAERVPAHAVTLASSFEAAVDAAKDCAARGVPVVVAAGGDGTVNAVANGLAGSESALGVVPLGTVNVFALETGLPTRWEKAWQVIAAGEQRSIDMGRIRFSNGREQVFVQFAGIGLDAEVVRDTTIQSKRLLGPFSYVLTGVRLLSEPLPMVTVRTEYGEEMEGTVILVGNGGYYGGRFRVFPDARNDDGWLDACVFTGPNSIDLVRYVQGVLVGAHQSMPDIAFLRSRRYEFPSQDALVEADGDLLGATPATIDVLPGALRIVAPA